MSGLHSWTNPSECSFVPVSRLNRGVPGKETRQCVVQHKHFLALLSRKALDPLFSGGLGSFRRLLYFSDKRQSVGSAAKHPPAVTSPHRWWPCFLFPRVSQKSDTCSSLFLSPFPPPPPPHLLSSPCTLLCRLRSSQRFILSSRFVSRFFLKGVRCPLKCFVGLIFIYFFFCFGVISCYSFLHQ